MDNWDDVVERALDFVLERKKFKKGDLTLEEYEYAKGEMRAAGRVFVEAALEEAAKLMEAPENGWMDMDQSAAAIRALKDKLP